MKIKITKNGKILLFVILGIIVLGSGGYLLWRTLQPETVAPEDSEAGGGAGSCCCLDDNVDGSCDDSNCPHSVCPSGLVCKDVGTKNGTCDDNGAGCGVCQTVHQGCYWSSEFGIEGLYDCDGDSIDLNSGLCYCTEGSQADDKCWRQSDQCKCANTCSSGPVRTCAQTEQCEFPLNAYYDSDTGQCTCVRWDQQSHKYGLGTYCSTKPLLCSFSKSCESEGLISCGVSGDGGDKTGCTVIDSCDSWCGGCGNLSVYKLYCKEEIVVTPSCGDGILGNTQGEECDPPGDACTDINGNASTCSDACKCPVIDIEETCGDGILGNTEGEQCELGDPTGVSCTWDVCNQTTCVCPSSNPDWSISKVGVESCIEDGETIEGKAIYTITVTNTGDAQGNIDRVVDNLDSKVIANYLNDISGVGTYASGQITWDLEGDDEIFSVDEAQTFTYYIQIPSSAFGTYDNTVTAYPSEGDSFSVDETVVIDCDIPTEEEETPQTGIFEDSVVRILFGLILITVGLNWNKLNYSITEYLSDRRIKNFENRVAKKK
ncbi:TPA: hypothetical protein DEP90_03245 [Patescibacteria group bacterium]|nr:hypothetical protein [Patescibacteria group bacterium]